MLYLVCISASHECTWTVKSEHLRIVNSVSVLSLCRSYIRFPLPQLDTSQSFESATLHVHVLHATPAFRIDLFAATSNWEEDEISWDHKVHNTILLNHSPVVTACSVLILRVVLVASTRGGVHGLLCQLDPSLGNGPRNAFCNVRAS